jgi:hypothetical protein
MAIMMLVCWAAPTSLQLLMVCSMHENQEDNISKLFLFMWVSSLGFLSLTTLVGIVLVNSI